jgi:hypothetical protein
MMLLFFRVFPIISIYEVEEAAEAAAEHHTEWPLVAEAE